MRKTIREDVNYKERMLFATVGLGDLARLRTTCRNFVKAIINVGDILLRSLIQVKEGNAFIHRIPTDQKLWGRNPGAQKKCKLVST